MTLAEATLLAQSRGLARLDAHMLVLHALGRPSHDRAWLLAHDSDELPPALEATLQSLIQRRRKGEPMAYITGFKEFFGLNLQVDRRVLDPRADTETLVEWALDVMDDWHAAAGTAPMAIDLGTGSGAIALALQRQRPQWNVQALDYSPEALAVARANAERLGIPVRFRQGRWLQGVHESFALIVSNPPYIAADDAHLADLTHEPQLALVSSGSGLDDIRSIVGQARSRLLPGGWLLLEHGYQQAPEVRALLTEAGFLEVQSRRDLAGIERCSGGQWPTVLP